jgi:hypothetical protein
MIASILLFYLQGNSLWAQDIHLSQFSRRPYGEILPSPESLTEIFVSREFTVHNGEVLPCLIKQDRLMENTKCRLGEPMIF